MMLQDVEEIVGSINIMTFNQDFRPENQCYQLFHFSFVCIKDHDQLNGEVTIHGQPKLEETTSFTFIEKSRKVCSTDKSPCMDIYLHF